MSGWQLAGEQLERKLGRSPHKMTLQSKKIVKSKLSILGLVFE